VRSTRQGPEAVQYQAVKEFAAVGGAKKKTKEEAVRFICIDDAKDEAEGA
jgi:hypothetical protein